MNITELIALITIFVIFIFFLTKRNKAQSIPDDIYRKLPDLINSKEAIGLDVRTHAEIQRNPCKGSLCIPLNELSGKIDSLPKDKILIVFCESGGRASFAISQLRKLGIAQSYNLGSWRQWNSLRNL